LYRRAERGPPNLPADWATFEVPAASGEQHPFGEMIDNGYSTPSHDKA